MTIDDALSGQAGLAGVQWVLYGAPVQRALQETIATLLAPPFTLREWRLLRAKVKPGRKVTAYYAVTLAEAASERTCQRAIAVTWTASPSAQERAPAPPLHGMEVEALAAGVAAPFRRLLACNDAWQMQIEVAPRDPHFPQLVRAMTPSHVTTRLATHGISATDWQIITLRYRPRQRHVLRYEPVTVNGGTTTPFFAKLSQDHEGETTAHLVQWAAEQLRRGNSGVGALCPHAWVAADQLLLYPYAPGAPISQLLLTGQSVLPWLYKAGAALRSLHTAPVPAALPLLKKTFATEVKATVQAGEHLAALAPQLYTDLCALVEAAHERYQSFPAVAPTFTHSDFKADHLLADGNQLTLIDFDSCALADPAADLGKFLADLHWWQTLGGRFDQQQAQAAFLTGYGAPTEALFYRRAQLYSALILAKNTVRRLNLFDEAWLTQSQALLQSATALLSQA